MLAPSLWSASFSCDRPHSEDVKSTVRFQLFQLESNPLDREFWKPLNCIYILSCIYTYILYMINDKISYTVCHLDSKVIPKITCVVLWFPQLFSHRWPNSKGQSIKEYPNFPNQYGKQTPSKWGKWISTRSLIARFNHPICKPRKYSMDTKMIVWKRCT